MKVIVALLEGGGLAFCRVEGIYLDQEVWSSIGRVIVGQSLNAFEADSRHLVTAIHELLVRKGSYERRVKDIGNTPHHWFRACAELLVVHNANGVINFCQLGTIHAFRKRQDKLQLAVPIHNVASELQAKSIEASCLPDIQLRTQQEIAQQLLYASPEVVPQLESMPRAEFLDSIAHVRSRVAGFFPEVDHGQVCYRNLAPEPSIGQIEGKGCESLVVFFPSVQHVIPYHRGQIQAVCEEMLRAERSVLPICSPIEVEDSSCIEVRVEDNRIDTDCIAVYQ